MIKNKKLFIILIIFLLFLLALICYRLLQKAETIELEPDITETIQQELPSREKRPAFFPEGPVER